MQMVTRLPLLQKPREGKGRRQDQQQLKASPQSKLQKPQARWPKTLNLNDKYPNKTRAKQQREEEMERLNEKYNLDCFSSSELDLELDEGEQYYYEHGYETLIWKVQEWIHQDKICNDIVFEKQLTNHFLE